jgi:poly(3-hydroxybutyrate) depolymerase
LSDAKASAAAEAAPEGKEGEAYAGPDINDYIVGGKATFDRNVTVDATYPDGGQRWFLLNMPKGRPAKGNKWPVIINSHGFGSSAENMAQVSGLWKEAPAQGIVAVHTQGYPGKGLDWATSATNGWNGGTCCGPAQMEKSDDITYF